MSDRIVCPGCRTRLVLRARTLTPTITCPRCMAALPNPSAGSEAATVTCRRCHRDYPSHSGSCTYCGAQRSSGGGGTVCAVCAEESPAHGANCPEADLKSLERRYGREAAADHEANRDSGATASVGWITILFVAGGSLPILGFQAALFVAVILACCGAVATRQNAWDGVVSAIVTVVGLFMLAGALLFGAVFIACSTGHLR